MSMGMGAVALTEWDNGLLAMVQELKVILSACISSQVQEQGRKQGLSLWVMIISRLLFVVCCRDFLSISSNFSRTGPLWTQLDWTGRDERTWTWTAGPVSSSSWTFSHHQWSSALSTKVSHPPSCFLLVGWMRMRMRKWVRNGWNTNQSNNPI